jgi:TonB family protein
VGVFSQVFFMVSDITLQIAVLALGSIILIFSVIAAKIHRRWAFTVVVFTALTQFGLSFMLIERNKAKDRDLQEQRSNSQKAFADSQKTFAEEHELHLQVRNQLADALSMASRQQKLIEALRDEFASENQSKNQVKLVNEQLKTEKERYDGLITQYNAQLDQLAKGLVSKDHFDKCNVERGRIDTVSGASSWGYGLQAPIARFTPEPEYSEEARKAKFEGASILSAVVMPSGIVCNIKVRKPLGMGLDEEAIKAASRWIFEPAKKDGKPVPFVMNFEMHFHLY